MAKRRERAMTSLTAKEVTTVKGALAKFEMAVRDAMRNALAEARGDNADAAGAGNVRDWRQPER